MCLIIFYVRFLPMKTAIQRWFVTGIKFVEPIGSGGLDIYLLPASMVIGEDRRLMKGLRCDQKVIVRDKG